MRDLRFRAWLKDDEIMVTPISMIFDGVARYTTRLFNKDYAPSQLVIMQFTGLKDKNGEEIFEGDVLQSDLREWKDDKNYPTFVVKWSQPLTRFTLVRPSGNDGFWGLEMTDKYAKGSVDHLEVIGNIYENPDLLGED